MISKMKTLNCAQPIYDFCLTSLSYWQLLSNSDSPGLIKYFTVNETKEPSLLYSLLYSFIQIQALWCKSLVI